MEIEFVGATFTYRKRENPVLDELDLTLPPGRTVLLGPNGAGKSTLLGIAASVLRLSRGHVAIGGLNPEIRQDRVAYRRRVAWMPQAIVGASGLTVREQVAMSGWLAGSGRTDAWQQALSALDQVALTALADHKATKLSGGQRARMGLAQALVHAAEVLLLDEPTAAMDPDQKQSFATLLQEVSTGRNVVVSTHDVSDLAEIFDRVVVLQDGRVRFEGSTTEFLHPAGSKISAVDAYRTAIGSR